MIGWASTNIRSGFFTDNKEVIKNGTIYLQITALMEPIYPIFFISNALIQGMKKPNIVFLFTVSRMVILPSILLWFLIFKLNFSFAYVFWGLLINFEALPNRPNLSINSRCFTEPS